MTNQHRTDFLKVVTVDNSPIIADRLQTIIAQIETVVYAGNATNVATALAMIEHVLPHVVILDINLDADPQKPNGIDLLIMLRKKYHSMKIIMLTNLTDLQYRHTCYYEGADYFLDKSNEFDKIAGIVSGFAPLATTNLINRE